MPRGFQYVFSVTPILRTGFVCSLVWAVVVACAPPEIVEDPFQPVTSHEEYRSALETLGLDDTELGRSWFAAARTAIDQPMIVETPFEEIVILDPHHPAAIGYEFVVRRGRAVTISVDTELGRYYADLFRVEDARGGDGPVLTMVASRPDDSPEIRFEPRRDGRYLLRIQPELLRGGRVSVRIVETASLAFPVEGVGPGAIWSFFGDGRDGGLRVHEGIDIFAPRGTPLLAASDALVRTVGVRDRGGNVVSLYDEERDLLFYYAHLEEQLVEQGERVIAGQVIGTVGNTGNAITTPPHLHIGVYQGSWRAAVDPWDYFVDPPLTEPPAPSHASLAGTWLRLELDASLRSEVRAPVVAPRWVNRNPALRRAGAGETMSGRGSSRDDDDVPVPAPVRGSTDAGSVPEGTPLFAVGAAGSLVRVRAPDGREGYVDPSALSSAFDPLVFADAVSLRHPVTADLVAELAAGMTVSYLGSTADRVYVKTDSGRVGFVDRADG